MMVQTPLMIRFLHLWSRKSPDPPDVVVDENDEEVEGWMVRCAVLGSAAALAGDDLDAPSPPQELPQTPDQ